MKNKIIIFGVILILLFVLGFIALKTFVYPIKYKEQIMNYSSKYGLDPYLVLAIINTESGFDKEAKSHKEAKGLMQITEATAKEINEVTNSTEVLDESNIYDENVNIEIGCMYIASLISKFNGNYYLAICSYNAGIGNVRSWIEKGIVSKDLSIENIDLPFKETSNYLKKVLFNYKIYKKLYTVIG